jgi:hypothetical protein
MVDQPVEERVGQRGVAQCLMPVLHRQRPGDTRRPALVAIFEPLQQVPSVCIPERGHSPVIEEKQRGFGARRHQLWIAPVAFGQEQVVEPPGEPEREGRPAVPTRLRTHGTGEPGLPHARRAREKEMAMVADPRAGREAGPQGVVPPPRMPRVAVFAPGRLAPFRLAEAGGEPTGLALGPLPVDHEAQARVDTEGRDVRQVQWLAQGLRPPRQAEECATLEEQIAYDQEQLESLATTPPECQRLLTIPGIGPLTATALIAAVGDVGVFKNGRQCAAWLGLVPKQHSTGGQTRL